MTSVQETLEIDVPVRQAYDQWTQFESFPNYMEGIEEVQQLSDTEARFRGKVGGVERTWTARIVEQVPDERIQWRSIDGAPNGGTVLFEPLDGKRTKVTLMLDYEPQGAVEKAGDAMGLLKHRVKSDLKNFKIYIEERREPEGQWRGEVHGGRETGRDDELPPTGNR